MLKIVSVQSIAQMPSQSGEPMSWEDNEVVVKEEANYDSDATIVYEPEEYDGVSFDFILSCNICITSLNHIDFWRWSL